MSRNKDIEYLHRETGWSYKTCRDILKVAKWDLAYAMRAVDLINDNEFQKAISEASRRILEVGKSLSKALESIVDQILDCMAKMAEDLSPVIEAASHCQPVDSDPIDWEEME